MIVVLFGVYAIFLALIWWFFMIAKIHAYKFKDFSPNIEKITKILALVLFVLSIIWAFFVYNFKWSFYTVKVDESNSDVSEENW